jgi:hypothetical protein
MIAGDLTVPAGIRPDHHGLITGSLVIEPTRLASIHGMAAASSSITGAPFRCSDGSGRTRIRASAKLTSRPKRKSGHERHYLLVVQLLLIA